MINLSLKFLGLYVLDALKCFNPPSPVAETKVPLQEVRNQKKRRQNNIRRKK